MTTPLHILQNGVPRSGNLWLHYVIRQLLHSAAYPVTQFLDRHPVAQALASEDMGIAGIAGVDFIDIRPPHCFFSILDVFRWPITDLAAYIDASTHVTSHSHWNEATTAVYRRFSHVIYIVRDPRDMALSMSRFAFTPFNRLHRPLSLPTPADYLDYHFSHLIQQWVQHVGGHCRQRNEATIHFVFYERLLTDPTYELHRLAAFLGLTLADPQINTILANIDFAAIKQQQSAHLSKGQWGGWREELGEQHIRQTQRLAGPLLQALGYPLDRTEAADWTAARLALS